MSRNHFKPNESDPILPAIKASRSTYNSPRNQLTKSPVLDLIGSKSPVSRPSPILFKSEERPSIEVQDKFTRRITVTSIQLSKTVVSPTNLNNLIKVIEEQDRYIRTIESEFSVNKNTFSGKALQSVRNSEIHIAIDAIFGRTSEVGDEDESRRRGEHGNSPSFAREDLKYKKDRFKNYEIYKLKKQIEDNQAVISKLTVDSARYKKKQLEYEGAVGKIVRIEKEIEEIKAEAKYETENIKNEIYDSEMILNCKIIDFNDMSELLKRSEEKRHYSNEYNIFMESNSAKFKDKIGSLNHQKITLECEIEEINKKIVEKEGIIRELEGKMERASKKLEYERMKNTSLTYNYNSAKEELRNCNEQNEIIKNKHRNEKEKLKEILHSQKTDKPLSKNSEQILQNSTTLDEQPTINETSREEVQKWQQQYAVLEKELNQAKEDLQKMKKNSNYLTIN